MGADGTADAAAQGRDRHGVELVPSCRLRLRAGALVAAQRRDLRRRADRRRSACQWEPDRRADGARARRDGRLRALLLGQRHTRREGDAGGHERDPRCRERGRVRRACEGADQAPGEGPQCRRGGPLHLPRGGQLDDPQRWRRARPRWRQSRAGPRRRAPRARNRLVAARDGADDREVLRQRPLDEQAVRGVTRARAH